jgi:catechol 2,3-dioxygenase-like lactoylglutathione lyase family enzyme
LIADFASPTFSSSICENLRNLRLHFSVSETIFRIVGADHTGITVSNLERSLAFWRDVLGFELSHTAHQTGEMAKEITGVEGAEIKLAVLKAPGGHKIELLECLAPADRKRTNLRPCDVGSVHVALLVHDLDAVLERIARSDWKIAGKPQRLQSGPNAGKRVVYVRDPDGATIEFMEMPRDFDISPP